MLPSIHDDRPSGGRQPLAAADRFLIEGGRGQIDIGPGDGADAERFESDRRSAEQSH